MVLVDGRSTASSLIQATHRMAQAMHIPWLAAHLDAPQHLFYSPAEEACLTENLRLVERLGGEVVQIQPSRLRPAQDLLDLAKARRVTDIFLALPPARHSRGRQSAPRERAVPFLRGGRAPWLQSTSLEQLLANQLGIAIHLIPMAAPPSGTSPRISEGPGLRRLGLSTLGVALTTLVGFGVHHYLDLADLVVLYMLCITVMAARFGRWAALWTSVLCVAAFDFFFVPPTFTFAVHDVRHLGTFTIMLGVGWVVANLAERIRAQARIALEREQHTGALYRLGAVLAEGGSILSLRDRIETHLSQELDTPLRVLLADAQGQVSHEGEQTPGLDTNDWAVAQWAMEHGVPAGHGTDTLPASRAFYLPLPGAERPVGVLTIAASPSLDAERRGLLSLFASQISLALERARLAEERTEARIRAEHEHLRSTLLSSVSHDLRTPLSTITGATTALLDPGPEADPGDQRMLLDTIHQEACRLQRLVNNLLDLTKLESGQVQVKKEWVPLEEVVGSAISRLEKELEDRNLRVQIPETWVAVDPVLFEQVLLNLLDNALKFSQAPIEIQGWLSEEKVLLQIADHGPGIPRGEEERIFEKLYRGPGTQQVPGAGLGLAICRGIIQAHDGTIAAHRTPGGGASFLITLPREAVPSEFLNEPPE